MITKEEIFSEAISLSPMDKAKLVELLLSSFSFKDRKEIDEAWSLEAEDRLQAIKNGEMDKVPMEAVFDSLDG